MKHVHYGWVIVGMSAGIVAARSLPLHSFGVFLKPLTMEFGWDRGALSAAISLCVIIGGSLGILSGRLNDRYGPRLLVTIGGLSTGIAFLLLSQINAIWHVYLIWGIFMSVGFGCCIIPVMTIIPRWFIKRRGIAMGITMAGASLGGIISPLLAQWLIDAYGWRYAFITLGLITIITIIPLAQFMKHSPQRVGLKPYGGDEITEDKQSHSSVIEGLSFSQAIRTIRFWLFGLTLAIVFFCSMSSVTVHIVPHAIDIGIPAVTAASILSITAGIGIIGRLGIGLIFDRIGGTLVLSACIGLATLAIIWLLFAKEIWMFYMFAAVFGFTQASFITLLPVVTAELFGLASLGTILGSVVLFATLGDALGATVTGSIFDITGSYSLAFLILGAICAAAVIPSLFLLRYKGK